jgi:hypothetical protein
MRAAALAALAAPAPTPASCLAVPAFCHATPAFCHATTSDQARVARAFVSAALRLALSPGSSSFRPISTLTRSARP